MHELFFHALQIYTEKEKEICQTGILIQTTKLFAILITYETEHFLKYLLHIYSNRTKWKMISLFLIFCILLNKEKILNFDFDRNISQHLDGLP